MSFAPLVAICLLAPAQAEPEAIYTSYRIPEYDESTWALHASPLVLFNKTGEQYLLHTNFGFAQAGLKQSETLTRTTAIELDFDFNKQKDIDANFTFVGATAGRSQYYFGAYDGLFLGTGINSIYHVSDDTEGLNDFHVFDVGFGLGRITMAQSVAQALAIADELGLTFTDAQVHELAGLIASQPAYSLKHREDASIAWYGEMRRILGDAADIMKVRQILESPVYQIFPRRHGWEVEIGYSNTLFFHSTEVDDTFEFGDGAMFLRGEWARPMGLENQASMGARWRKGFGDPDEPFARIQASAAYLDLFMQFDRAHNYTWRSFVRCEFSNFSQKDVDGGVRFMVNAGTMKNIIGSLYLNADGTMGRSSEHYIPLGPLSTKAWDSQGEMHFDAELSLVYFLK